MDVVSICPLPVASLLWQRKATWVLTVVCKGTFSLRSGEMTPAPEQEAPNEDDSFWNDDQARSLRSVSDLAPLKPRVDVLLVGGAFAPGGRPVSSLVARLALGDLDKSIEVWGDRSFDASGAPSRAASFSRLPLTYERAAGGPQSFNPVGVAPGARNRQGLAALPNLQPCGYVVGAPNDIIPPMGFGPIAPTWPGRREKLGHYATESGGWRGPLLPDDVDAAFFNTAPPDQQLTTLQDDERITLENLHPDYPSLVTALPRIRPYATLEGRGGSHAIALQCDTLWIDTDSATCTLTWRGQVPLGHPNEAGRVVVALDRPLRTGRQATWTGMGGPPPPKDESGATETLVGALDIAVATLPFAPVAQAPSANDPPRPPAPDIGLPFPTPAKDPLSQSGSSWAAAPLPPPPPPRAAQASSPWLDSPPREADIPDPPPPAPATFGQMAAFTPAPLPPARAPALAHAGEAVLGGLAAASNAAAPQAAPRLAAVPDPARAPLMPSAALDPGTVLQLVWYDPESVPRMRRKHAFRSILDALEGRPLDPEVDDPAFAAEPIDIEDRREVLELLARAEASPPESVSRSLAAGVREGSKLVALLDVFAGELAFPFDDLEKLKATMTTVAPLVGNDEALKGAVEAAKDFVAMPGLSSTSAVAEGLTRRLKDTYGATPRATPPGYVETQTDRALLEQRHYQRRVVLGAPHIRAVLGSGSHATPVYLPDALAAVLPMYQRFKVRVIAEVHPRVDQFESHPAALKVVAMGWVMANPAGRW